jgi:hypothetical protein
MNSRRLILLSTLALVPPATYAQPSPLERTHQARINVDALLGPRRNPPPAPADPANPFTTPGTVTVEPTPGNPTPVSTISSEQEILTRTLKLGGTAMLGGRLQLLVNQLSYKEGDLIAVRDGDQVLRVRLVRIAPPSAVFELNGNEVILRIRN